MLYYLLGIITGMILSTGSIVIAILILRFNAQKKVIEKIEKFAIPKQRASIMYQPIEEHVQQMEINDPYDTM